MNIQVAENIIYSTKNILQLKIVSQYRESTLINNLLLYTYTEQFHFLKSFISSFHL
jgi:hypothetical protein